MADAIAAKMDETGFELPEWAVAPNETLVREFEDKFGLSLPEEYREFLVKHGGKFGGANCQFLEPTPCGKDTMIDCFYGFTKADRSDNVTDATALIDGAPDVIAIGDNMMGAMFWLKCTGKDAGHVYMHDHQRRSGWADEQFMRMFPDLHPDIQEYLRLRKEGKLPEKPEGYEHVYRLSTSFTEFVLSLEKQEDEQ
jgi:SMI1 / KNR4 family (SUKH-1)